jgi:hypothetical protein
MAKGSSNAPAVSDLAQMSGDPVGVRSAALSAAATLVSGRGMNRADRSDALLGDAVIGLAEQFVLWLATGRRDG